MALTLSEVSELKQELSNKFGVTLHFHDACGAQSFSLDAGGMPVSDEAKAWLTDYFQSHRINAQFSKTGNNFTVR
ncbi:MAG: hypothetical protein J6Z36_02120 [Clostridia bacterium]|nr:hypothetical protein [Clostridia bacterium]